MLGINLLRHRCAIKIRSLTGTRLSALGLGLESVGRYATQIVDRHRECHSRVSRYRLCGRSGIMIRIFAAVFSKACLTI